MSEGVAVGLWQRPCWYAVAPYQQNTVLIHIMVTDKVPGLGYKYAIQEIDALYDYPSINVTPHWKGP